MIYETYVFFPMISETLWLVTAFPIGFPEVLAGKERWRQRQRCLGLVFQGAAQSWDWAAVSKWHWVAMDDSSQVPAACLGRSRPKSFCQLSLHKWPEGLGRFRKAHEHAIFAADIESVKNNTSGVVKDVHLKIQVVFEEHRTHVVTADFTVCHSCCQTEAERNTSNPLLTNRQTDVQFQVSIEKTSRKLDIDQFPSPKPPGTTWICSKSWSRTALVFWIPVAVEPLAAASVLPMAETTTGEKGEKGEWRRARRGSVRSWPVEGGSTSII